jgi:signal transduction histidine kinase
MGVIGAIAMTSITVYMYRGSVDALVASEEKDLSAKIDAAASGFDITINFAREEVVFLSKTPPIAGIIRARANGGIDPLDGTSEELWRNRLATIFTAILEARSEYSQVQYVGMKDGGHALVRVDQSNNREIQRTPDDGLATNGDHPYFQDPARLSKGEAYLSEVDMNEEFSKIEKPYRPVIRVATPLFDESGNLQGALVINIDASRLFEIVDQTLGKGQLRYITNDSGDYLAHPDPGKTFAFDRGHRYRIQDDLPELSSLFGGGDSSYSGFVELSSERYLAFARRIYFDPRQSQRYLVFAELSPNRELLGRVTSLRDKTALITIGLLLASMAAVIWLARRLVRPLREMTKAAASLAVGNWSIDLGAMTRQRDETGALARAFDAMVHEIKAREEELAARAKELTRSNEELAQFAFVASHDLQEPLRMVASYLELLSRRYQGKLDADADEFIGYAVDGAARMKRLINDLLGYSRVSNAPLKLETVDTGSVVNAAVKVLADRVKGTGAEVTIEPLPEVKADSVMVERLFLNLLDNALKYRSELPPRIRFACERKDDFWKFSVTDNGIGIDPNFADKVFEIFTRLHGREKYPGNGIGLASCKRIVERHGGEIWIEPAPSGGSIFFFTLPA